MADGSPDDRAGPHQIPDITYSVPDTGLCDSKKCSDKTLESDGVKLSFYTELKTSESCEKSESRGVASNRSATAAPDSRNPCEPMVEESDDRKKRCFDRYDSSESSDSGVAVLSPTESSVCSGSDITEPLSPRSPPSPPSPESGCSVDDGGGARMPPWASEPAPRRLAAQPAPVRRPNPHRRSITDYFNKSKLKREATTTNDDTKKKCLPKNGVTDDLEKYISYLSQTLSPKVMLDVNMQTETQKPFANGTSHCKATDLTKKTLNTNGLIDFSKSKDNNDKNHSNMNGFVVNGLADKKRPDLKTASNPSANGIVKPNKNVVEKRKLPIAAANDAIAMNTAPIPALPRLAKSNIAPKPDPKANGVVSSTTKLDSRMNGVTCGSNNISLKVCKSPTKKEAVKKTPPAEPKRRYRKSGGCLASFANMKNLSWCKTNNLKQQVQMQKQNCANAMQQQSSPVKTVPEASTAPKMNIPNGVRQVSMTMNGSLGNLNMPINNIPNCHQINIPQPCNGAVTSTHLPSFVAVPQNVMLTTLRIPQNGIQPQTINQPNNLNNLNAFNRPNVNVNVSSPTKLANGQFVFPFVQNLNGTVVQIPNLMAKMPNFVLPQTPQLTTQRQDHLQNQQAAQILINGTLLKLANTMPPTYSNLNKPGAATSQAIPLINKNVTGLPTMGMTVQPKPNYAVNLSHPMLVPQPGFIVTSVPNMNVKETWSYTAAAPSSQTSCSNPIVHHPSPILPNFSTQALHRSSIPIAPKPPDNPIQGTEPPSSTVKEPEIGEVQTKIPTTICDVATGTSDVIVSKCDVSTGTRDISITTSDIATATSDITAPKSDISTTICDTQTPKCDMPWLSKTVNNNIVPLDSKLPSRPFAQVSLSSKFDELLAQDALEKSRKEDEIRKDFDGVSLRKVEEVARREETIFTQITVLKDVSSNVQSTVIEANYSSATTESSESGIGTDKSIDSPSDSQTSKECDDDSLSLSVSVCEEIVCSQKSPILKQPKTLRFPPRNPVKPTNGKRTSSTDTTATVVTCNWENCKNEFDNDADLLEHLQSVHVESQAGKENYVCLWQGCKVRGKPSCSRLWLERHALSHGGNKPFKCIFDGCERRFSTQILLQRHVNTHFTEVSPNASGSKKTTDSVKLIRRNGKKLRYRRQPWSARMFDFFDAGTMEGLAWRLLRSTRWRLGGSCPLREPTGRHTLTLHAALMATRYNVQEARREALLTYYPPYVIEDEWVPEKDVKRIKRVEIADLPVATKVLLYDQFSASYRKTPSPPPVKKETPQPAQPSRLLPARHCTSSRLLNNLLKKKEAKSDCSATNVPMIYGEEEKEKVEVSGAKKRKMGRRHGGNAFWPCGR